MIDGNLAAEYRLPDLTKMSKQTENLYPVKSGKILTFELFCPADDRSCRRIWHVLELPPVAILFCKIF